MAKVRKNLFDEYEKVKKLVMESFPTFDVRNLCVVLGRLGIYHYSKNKGMLIGEDRKLYDLLIENSYNPFTVYRWALLERVPNEIRFQINNHNLSQKNASKLFFERKHETDTSLQVSIRRLGLQLVREM